MISRCYEWRRFSLFSAVVFFFSRYPVILASAQEPAFVVRCGLHNVLKNRNTGIRSKWRHNYNALIEPTVVEDPTTILTSIDTDIFNRLVDQRSLARWEGNYARADELREEIHQVLLPPGYEVWMEDIPRKLGGGTNWKLVFSQANTPPEALPGPLVLQLAHAALGLAVEASVQTNLERAKRTMVGGMMDEVSTTTTPARNDDDKTDSLQSIVHQTKERLQHASVQYELGGRKAADAAFWFALAGVQDAALFDSLRDLATLELQRFGERPSCRAKDVYQILERLAAAGIRSRSDDDQLLDVARKCLSLKFKEADRSVNDDNTALLDFHSDRSLLLIWKFSTKQKKQRAFLESALKHWERHEENSGSKNIHQKKEEPGIVDNVDECSFQSQPPIEWDKVFADPTRPLVVDVGCGMGVSLLGLATCRDDSSSKLLLQHDQLSTSWSDYNFCGVDLGGLGVGYARGLASRWGVEDRLHFVVDSAENFVSMVEETYPGPIRLCLIQFPTPYRLQKGDGSGNSQLPTSAQDGFMVSQELLRLIRKMLARTQGKLLLQSNCEDVAVWMRSKAWNMEGGYSLLTKPELQPDPKSPPLVPRIPQRTADWIAMGGVRADGPGWYKNPLLPRQGATETEVACILNGTPVHRCVLIPELDGEEEY
jgi:hypothetical protein